jgi:DNA-binding response OmpR family regulator
MAKILVIDDDDAIVGLLKLRLIEAGHKVFTAMDATGGMMIAAREKPDLITLDFSMPAGDGAKTLQRLRGNTITAGIPIIFVSGRSRDELESVVPNAANVRFLQKPIEMPQLHRLISELLGAPPPAPPKAPPEGPQKPSTDGGALGGDILDIKL